MRIYFFFPQENPIRGLAVRSLVNAISKVRHRTLLTEIDVHNAANIIEESVYKHLSKRIADPASETFKTRYKDDIRRIVNNLKDPGNDLVERIWVSGEVDPKRLVEMSHADLHTAAAKERAQVAKASRLRQQRKFDDMKKWEARMNESWKPRKTNDTDSSAS